MHNLDGPPGIVVLDLLCVGRIGYSLSRAQTCIGCRVHPITLGGIIELRSTPGRICVRSLVL